jgi:hypothetical protein
MKYKLLIILMIGLITSAQGQVNNPALVKLQEVFDKGSSDFPKNKVFVKTDKDIYCPGEKIWFKAEAFNCLTENPSEDVELIVMLKQESGEVITDCKYLLVDGTCDNQITIPPWAKKGNVFLVAYTPKALKTNDASLAAIKHITINSYRNNDYMLGMTLNKQLYSPGEEVKVKLHLSSVSTGNKREKMLISLYDLNHKIFTERVTVTANAENELKLKLPDKISNGLYIEVAFANNSVLQKLPVYTTADNILVEFYPEGGSLLTNNLQRILYRAVDPFGEPIDVSGKIYDQLGNQTGVGKTLKKGYGLINLMPMSGQKYTFKIEGGYGNNQSFKIPETILDGSVFTLVKTEDSTLKVAVLNSGKYVDQTLTLAAIYNGEIMMSYEFEGLKKNNLKISTATLPIGIINFVVFSKEGELLSERLVYNTPNEDINIDIETQLFPTKKNGEVDVAIDLSKFIEKFGKSAIDVRIVDKFNLYNQEQDKQQSFLKYPLLTPIPKTVLDIYLTNIELIANEYRHYKLSDLLTDKKYSKPESNKTLNGIVTDKNHKPVQNATVMAVQSNNLTLATTTSDEKGRFAFDRITSSNDITVKAFNTSGKKTYNVQVDMGFAESLDELILSESFKQNPQLSTVEITDYYQQNKELLRQIGSEQKKPKAAKQSSTEKYLHSGTSILEVIKMTKPFHIDNNQIVFYGSQNSFNFQSGAIIVIDGQKMGTDISVLNTLSPFDVKSINISTNPVEIQRYTGLNSVGIIEIATRREPADFVPEQNEKELEFQPKATFDAEKMPHNNWIYQTTLLWENNIKPDENGKIFLKLKASEIKSDFIVHVDVISESGMKLHETSSFSTKKR